MHMFSKEYVKKVLHINGLSPNSADEEIRSVLLYAKCENVDSAITALRDANTDQTDDICGLQQAPARCNVLLVDKRLSPDMIKNLLGVDMELSYDELEAAREARRSVSWVQIGSIFALSLACAALAILGLMWHYQIAFFYPGL